VDRIPFYYVYIIQSLSVAEGFHTGFTENLEQRLQDHNSGKNPHTAKTDHGELKRPSRLPIASRRLILSVT
jgi:predicted GIY-YIG superfamily endonuclease